MSVVSKADTAVSLNAVEKHYPNFSLGPLDLDVPVGTVLAVVGPNGAGKTTMLRCIAGLSRADAGTVSILGRSCSYRNGDFKAQVGFAGEPGGFFQRASVGDSLERLVDGYPSWDPPFVAELTARLNLPLETPVGNLSKGNRAKLRLVAALGHRPNLLLLDEPTSGMDPVAQQSALDVLREVHEYSETTTLYCTHRLNEIARFADAFLFLVDGGVAVAASTLELCDRWRRIAFELETSTPDLRESIVHQRTGNHHRLISMDHDKTMESLKTLGAEIIETSRMTFEEIGVEILKHSETLRARRPQ